jgi:hypothetical protein
VLVEAVRRDLEKQNLLSQMTVVSLTQSSPAIALRYKAIAGELCRHSREAGEYFCSVADWITIGLL